MQELGRTVSAESCVNWVSTPPATLKRFVTVIDGVVTRAIVSVGSSNPAFIAIFMFLGRVGPCSSTSSIG